MELRFPYVPIEHAIPLNRETLVKSKNRGVVYSSEHGRMCPRCGNPGAACICNRSSDPAASGDGVVRIRREVKGRRGKAVTTVSGVPLAAPELKDLAAELKRMCGTGGSLKNGIIEIQGDHREALHAELEKRGFTVKRAGG